MAFQLLYFCVFYLPNALSTKLFVNCEVLLIQWSEWKRGILLNVSKGQLFFWCCGNSLVGIKTLGVYFSYCVIPCFRLFLTWSVKSVIQMALFCFSVLTVEVSHKCVQADEPARRQGCRSTAESCIAASALLCPDWVEIAESKWSFPHNQTVLFKWSGWNPWTTNISFVVCSKELWDTLYFDGISEALSEL